MAIYRRPGNGPSNGLLLVISAVLIAVVAVGIWAIVTGRIGGPKKRAEHVTIAPPDARERRNPAG